LLFFVPKNDILVEATTCRLDIIRNYYSSVVDDAHIVQELIPKSLLDSSPRGALNNVILSNAKYLNYPSQSRFARQLPHGAPDYILALKMLPLWVVSEANVRTIVNDRPVDCQSREVTEPQREGGIAKQ